jgi:hypothetical protein
MNRFLRDSSILDIFGGSTKQKYATLDHDKTVDMHVALAEKIDESGFKPNVIIGIIRWGNRVANFLSDRYGEIPVYSIHAKSYKGLNVRGEVEIRQGLEGISLEGKKVLIADDIGDFGTTFSVVRKIVEHANPDIVKTACLVIKDWTLPVPDFWVDKTDKWVLFSDKPYENCRHLLGNCPHSLSLEEARRIILTELKYPEKIIQEVDRRIVEII